MTIIIDGLKEEEKEVPTINNEKIGIGMVAWDLAIEVAIVVTI